MNSSGEFLWQVAILVSAIGAISLALTWQTIPVFADRKPGVGAYLISIASFVGIALWFFYFGAKVWNDSPFREINIAFGLGNLALALLTAAFFVRDNKQKMADLVFGKIEITC